MKLFKSIYLFITFATIFGGCQKWDYYKEFVPDGEKKYPSIDTMFVANPGNERLEIKWKHSNDPTVKHYMIYWNDDQDSLIYADIPKGGDTIVLYLNTPEGVYDFTVYSFDTKLNRSVPRKIPAVRVYGQNYVSTLYNRGLNINNPYDIDENGYLKINFSLSAESELSTEIKYTNREDEIKYVTLSKDENSVSILDYKAGTEILYKSSYKPVSEAIDIFYVKEYSILSIKN